MPLGILSASDPDLFGTVGCRFGRAGSVYAQRALEPSTWRTSNDYTITQAETHRMAPKGEDRHAGEMPCAPTVGPMAPAKDVDPTVPADAPTRPETAFQSVGKSA